MKRARTDSQPTPTPPRTKRQKLEPRTAPLLPDLCAARTASSTEYTKRLRGSARHEQQSRRRRSRAASRTSAQRHKRRSFGSDGSGSSALGGSEGTATSSSTASSSSSSNAQRELYAQRFGPPDVVLYVGACIFGVHLDVLECACPALCARLVALHSQSVVDNDSALALLIDADSDADSDADDRSSSPPITALPPFALRRIASTQDVVSSNSSVAVCPLASAAAATALPTWLKRRTVSTATPFASVECLAHAARTSSCWTTAAATIDSSTTATTATTATAAEHDYAAASPLLPRRRVERTLAFSADKENAVATDQHSPSAASPANSNDHVDADAELDAIAAASAPMHVAWRAAEPVAVASVLEFAYTGNVRLATPDSAMPVVALCRWLALTASELFVTSLRVAIADATLADWLPLLLVVETTVSDCSQRTAFVTQLLDWLQRQSEAAPLDRFGADVLAHVRLEHVAAIRDLAVVVRVVERVINCVRHAGVWRNVLAALDRWTTRAFGSGTEKRLPQSASQLPLALDELHYHFAPWDPFIALQRVHVGGGNSRADTDVPYVRPTTLFRFGTFAFQVRFEVDSLVLIQWRVIRLDAGDADVDEVIDRSDASLKYDVDTTDAAHCTGLQDPLFVLRGEMRVLYRCARGGPTHEQRVTLRYNHNTTFHRKWQPLIESSSATSRLVSPLELSAVRSEEDLASQSQSDLGGRRGDGGTDGTTDYLRAAFTGRFFVWGHALCTLVHYIAACTQFYSGPRRDNGELVRVDALEKMQRVPLATLLLVLKSDRLRVPGGETALLQVLALRCFGFDVHANTTVEPAYCRVDPKIGTDFQAVDVVRALFACVRWCFCDLSRILRTLAHAPRVYGLYDVIQSGLRDPLQRFPRRTPYGAERSPYVVVTSLVEFQIEAGDRGLSPDACSQESVDYSTP